MKFPTWLKVVLGLVVVCMGLVAANHVGGVLFVIANKTNPFEMYATYLAWYGEYKDDPIQKKRLIFAAVASLVVVYVLPLIIIERITRKVQSLHGDARWATPAEVRKSGLLGDKGIMVGKYRDQFLMLGGQLFVMLAAPTRGGKGVGVVIPNLLSYPDSVVVLDVKQENYDITSGYRALYGHECYLFNPFAEDGRSARWNPLSYVSENQMLWVTDILAIGYVLYPNEGKDTFFNDQARNLFLGLVLYLMETPELPRTIGEALRQSSGKGKSIKDYITDLLAERDASDRPLSDTCVQALQRFTANSDNTLASILASFNAPLTIWANPIVDAATSGDDFLLTDVRKKRMSIYLGITPDKLSQSALILNLFFSQLINLNTKELPQKNPALKYQCLLLMDEFTAIGKVDVINTAVSYMAGYNLRLLPIIQSMTQLASKYGEQDAQTLSTNHALRILFPPRENKDANEYSETLGYFTIKSTSTSINNQSLMPFGGAPSRGESMSDQRRALMLPQELREMGQDKEIITFENTKPIMADKVMYYKEPVFVERLKEVSPSLAALDRKRLGLFWVRPIPTRQQLEAAIESGELAAPVHQIDFDLHIARTETRKRDVTIEDLAEEGGELDLAALAHDFTDLPVVDDPENPSHESVDDLVSAFFGRLEPGAAKSEPTHEYVAFDLAVLDQPEEDDGVISDENLAEMRQNEGNQAAADSVTGRHSKKGGGDTRTDKVAPRKTLDLSILDKDLTL